MEMTENRSYPKMEEYLQRKKKMNIRKKFIEGMSVEEFMEYFEDPEKVSWKFKMNKDIIFSCIYFIVNRIFKNAQIFLIDVWWKK